LKKGTREKLLGEFRVLFIAGISAKLDKSDQGLEFHYRHSLGKQNKY